MACATFVRRILIPMLVLGLAIAHAQTITKVSGDGQLVIQSILSSNPMVVLVRDASGNPLPKAQVQWTVTSGPGGVTYGVTTTDATGQTSNVFVAAIPNPGQAYAASTVTATYSGVKVQFGEISVGETGNTPNVQAYPTPQPSSANLSGAAGTQGAQAIIVQVLVTQALGAGQQSGVPNVAITAIMDNPNDASTVACAGGTIYTNAAGAATCTPVYGGKIGSGSFTLSAGGLQNFDYRYQVVAGAPAVITALAGNNAIGLPGQPVTLTAQVTDIGGNLLSGVPMTWSVLVPGTATLSTTSSTTDNTGRVSTTATLGNSAGPVEVQLSTANGKVTFLFNLTVNVVVAGMNMVSGNNQSVLVNTEFPQPLVVQVNDAHNNPVAGAPVTFTLSSGSAILSGTTINTGANGQASITVTAGATAGPVVILAAITAANNTYTQTFNLTVTPPGPICDTNLADNDTFFNGASYAPNFISPGGIALIYCQGLANGLQGVVTSNDLGFGPLPTQVQNVTVQFGDAPVFAPIYYLANENGKQWIAVQVPFEIPSGPPPGASVPVVVTVNGEPNVNPLTAQVLSGAPGFLETVMSDGKSRAILLHADGTFVDVDTPAHMAQPGETLTAFVTGLIAPVDSSGNPVIHTNEFAPPGAGIVITTPVVMGVGHVGLVTPPTARYAHNLIGVWQVSFVVPNVSSSGDKSLDIGVPDPTTKKLILNKRGSIIPIN